MEAELKEKLANPKFWGGLSFLLIVLLSLWYAVSLVNQWLQDKQKVPLQNVIVSGQLSHADLMDVEEVIRLGQPFSFFYLDVDKAHKDVESLPWVYQASIRKEWPDTLKVYIIEQQAEASWNGDVLINQFGETFAPEPPFDSSLPMLFGPGGGELAALQGFKAMQGLLQNSNLAIAELFLSERYAWNIKLDNGISLSLGRTEFIDRLQRFIDVYPLLKKNEKTVAYVDLRYDTGLAVGWLEDTLSKQ